MSPHWHRLGAAHSVDQDASRFPRDSILHIHVTCIAPIKVLWRLSPRLTFNGYNFWILHYGAPRSDLDRDLVFPLFLKHVGNTSLQGYNGLDFKRKKKEREKPASSQLNIEYSVHAALDILYNERVLQWTQSTWLINMTSHPCSILQKDTGKSRAVTFYRICVKTW